MHPIIKLCDVGKCYSIGERPRYLTLRESITTLCCSSVNYVASLIQSFRGRTRRQASADEPSTMWALRDVNIEVAPGEVLGLIGRNGAGKSTLLKLLSRITEPTTGIIEIEGRVGSLLEVGTGFHPELTGRENIYLNGAILGMRRNEIRRKFDEIVGFAEVERFIDTPVKHYSSGMYVRLAFAVAAHLEPEILLVDEVLAVGDFAFQKKCLGKMEEVARAGRTVIFVSHNMAAVENLCTSCLLLNEGRVLVKGSPRDVVELYMRTDLRSDLGWRDFASLPGRKSSAVRITRVRLYSIDDSPSGSVRMGERLAVVVDFVCESRPIRPVLGIVIKTIQGVPVFGVNNLFIGGELPLRRVPAGSVTCNFDTLPLVAGTYLIDLYLGDGPEDLDIIQEAISFEVLPADVFGTGQLPPTECGPVFWPARFELSGDLAEVGNRTARSLSGHPSPINSAREWGPSFARE
jgi:lipopolysaccharide transport system ATP-binding protein